MPLSFAAGWPDRHPAEFAALLRVRLRFPTPPPSWRAQYLACEEFLATGAGPGPLRVPALVVHGTDDRGVPYANIAPLMARLPRGRLATLHGAGHLCWLERPAEVIDHIVAHVAMHLSPVPGAV